MRLKIIFTESIRCIVHKELTCITANLRKHFEYDIFCTLITLYHRLSEKLAYWREKRGSSSKPSKLQKDLVSMSHE